ncbi:MAG: DoxX family protein [Anaerolinea sp.]|nr:DoxX family protein [Anaerolinea sp.]
MKNLLWGSTNMENSKVVDAMFNKTIFSWLWLIVRIFVGAQWLSASVHKLESPEWMQTGEALKSFWINAVAIPAAPAKPAIYYPWFRIFVQSLLDNHSYIWFGKLVALGELLVGLALILGFLVGVAAFFGGVMNLSSLLAGSISSGPVLLVLEMLLLVAWKTAGYYGLDRYFFNFIGAPWKPGRWFQKKMP